MIRKCIDKCNKQIKGMGLAKIKYDPDFYSLHKSGKDNKIIVRMNEDIILIDTLNFIKALMSVIKALREIEDKAEKKRGRSRRSTN